MMWSENAGRGFIPRPFLNNKMEKIPYSEQIRRGYNYLANRVHELKSENKKLKKEIAELKAQIFRANFGGRLYCENGITKNAKR